MTQPSEIARAAQALQAAPADLGAWLALARALELGGESRRAQAAYEGLGEVANQIGSVALAVACARWLEAAGWRDRAHELLGAIAASHGRGSARVDKTLRSPPVPPPAESSPAISIDPSMSAALAAADTAGAAALAAGSQRAPARVPPTALLGVLERDELLDLVAMMEPVWRDQGAIVIEIGAPADSLYWIARGAVSVTRGDHTLGELRSNAFFGEIALLAGTTRTARVTCTEPCWLLEIPATALEQMAARAPRLARVLASHARARLLANVMKTSELFSRLSEDERRELLPRFETRFFQAGDKIVAQGSDNACLFVVVSGQVEVRSGDQVLARLGLGEGLGEMSLLSRQPATADVVAIEATSVLALEREQFDDIALKHPGLLAEVYKLLVTRDRQNRDAIVHDASDLIV